MRWSPAENLGHPAEPPAPAWRPAGEGLIAALDISRQGLATSEEVSYILLIATFTEGLMPELESSRPATRVGPGVEAGVTEPMIRQVVHAFYGKIRTDPALGPIFNRVIGDDWDAHLAKMCDFWSSVLLMTGRFKGAPMVAHARISEIRPTHFARWQHLFRQTVEQLCPPPAAALFAAKSEIIAQSLQLGIAASRGELPPARTASSR